LINGLFNVPTLTAVYLTPLHLEIGIVQELVITHLLVAILLGNVTRM
jgi:hypothetical protein